MANEVHSFDGFSSSADPVFNSEKLSKVLQIMYSKGVYGQISEEHKEYEMIKKMKVGEEVGRSLNFQLQFDFGPSAVGATAVDEYVFKEQDQPTLEEKAAFMKAKGVTLGISLKLLKRSAKSPKFENPLKVEVDAKAIASKRLLCGELHKDGSGVYGKIASHSASTAAGQEIDVVLESDRGGEVRAIELGDLLSIRAVNGSEVATLKVTDKDRAADSLKATVSEIVNVDAAAGNYVVRKADLDERAAEAGTAASTNTKIAAAIDAYEKAETGQSSGGGAGDVVDTEFDKLSLNLCGLETLFASDGRKVHDIKMP